MQYRRIYCKPSNNHPMENKDIEFKLVDKSSGLPLYLQIEEDIRSKIHSHLLAPGDKIPSEEDLAKSYGVSRMTARRAISELDQKGLLFQRAGVGTFVSNMKLFANYKKLTSFTEDAVEQGKKPGAELISIKRMPADETLAEALMLKVNDPVICVERLRKADDLPVAIQCSYVSEILCPNFYEDAQTNYQSMVSLLQSYGLHLARGIENISATIADDTQAKLLEVKTGDPLLYIERITIAENGIPGELVKTYNRPDMYNCTIMLVR